MYEGTAIAFQGSAGSFSEDALIRFFGEKTRPVPCKDFVKAFEAVENGACEYGIVPIENSIIGSIFACFDRFAEYPSVAIIGEITIKIEHALIGLAGTKPEEITTVYSQLPGLEQCSAFLSQQGWSLVPFEDTAAAVQHVAAAAQKHNAAVASARAAGIYGLSVLRPNIQNHEKNFTRFAVIKKTPRPMLELGAAQLANVNTGFIIFSAVDRPGSLLECLLVFRANGINLHKIESRPIAGKPWEYQFLAELDCSAAGGAVIPKAVEELAAHATDSRIIGLYNKTLSE